MRVNEGMSPDVEYSSPSETAQAAAASMARGVSGRADAAAESGSRAPSFHDRAGSGLRAPLVNG
jgi:hypothetical protein